MTTTHMSPALSEQPTPVRRTSDWLVLILVIASLLGAWRLRQTQLNASDAVAVPDTPLRMRVPARSIAQEQSGDLYAVSTPAGLAVRVNSEPVPPIGSDLLGLVTFRAKARGEQGGVFKSVETRLGELQGKPVAIMEYQYVSQGSSKFFTTNLRLMHGYELIVPIGPTVYMVALEAPDAQWDLVRAQWPALIDSIRFTQEGK